MNQLLSLTPGLGMRLLIHIVWLDAVMGNKQYAPQIFCRIGFVLAHPFMHPGKNQRF